MDGWMDERIIDFCFWSSLDWYDSVHLSYYMNTCKKNGLPCLIICKWSRVWVLTHLLQDISTATDVAQQLPVSDAHMMVRWVSLPEKTAHKKKHTQVYKWIPNPVSDPAEVCLSVLVSSCTQKCFPDIVLWVLWVHSGDNLFLLFLSLY